MDPVITKSLYEEHRRRADAIREYKVANAKEHLSFAELDTVLGDHCGGRNSRPALDCSPERRAETAAKIAGIKKKRAGGIIGVRPDPQKGRSTVSYLAVLNPTGRSVIVKTTHCIGRAVEIRNAMAEEYYPGQDEYKCDMDAALRRWGCTCGRHSTGDKA